MRMAEHADLAVGHEQAAQHVMLGEALERLAQRALHERAPGLARVGGVEQGVHHTG